MKQVVSITQTKQYTVLTLSEPVNNKQVATTVTVPTESPDASAIMNLRVGQNIVMTLGVVQHEVPVTEDKRLPEIPA